jgi:hypothetical protein
LDPNAQRLFVFGGVVDGRGTDQFQLPREAFAHTDPSAVVKLEARQMDGEPLPAWLQFNSVTGQFQGTPPAGVSGRVDVEVTARDADGREASVAFKLEMGTPASELSQPVSSPAQIPRGVSSSPAGAAGGTRSESSTTDTGVESRLASSAGAGSSSIANFDGFSRIEGATGAGLGTDGTAIASSDGAAATGQGFAVFRVTKEGAGMPVALTDIQARLFVYQGISVAVGFDQYQIPREAFAHTDPSAIVTLNARLASGDNLPSWLSFDSTSGTFRGVPPGGVPVTLDLMLTATDAEGREASVEFKLELGVSDGARESAPKPIRVDADSPMLLGSDEASVELERQAATEVAGQEGGLGVKEKAIKVQKQSANSFAEQLRAAKIVKDPVLAKVLESKPKQVNRIGS